MLASCSCDIVRACAFVICVDPELDFVTRRYLVPVFYYLQKRVLQGGGGGGRTVAQERSTGSLGVVFEVSCIVNGSLVNRS